jgi:large subunit ribosomal protein L28
VRSRCELCGKGVSFGHNVSHSNHKSARTWKPNVQKTTIMIDGKPRRVHACTSCIRTLQKRANA